MVSSVAVRSHSSQQFVGCTRTALFTVLTNSYGNRPGAERYFGSIESHIGLSADPFRLSVRGFERISESLGQLARACCVYTHGFYRSTLQNRNRRTNEHDLHPSTEKNKISLQLILHQPNIFHTDKKIIFYET